MEVIWLIAGFGVGAAGMWTILQVQSGNNFGIGGSSPFSGAAGVPTNPTQTVADGPPAPNPSDSTGNFLSPLDPNNPNNVTP